MNFSKLFQAQMILFCALLAGCGDQFPDVKGIYPGHLSLLKSSPKADLKEFNILADIKRTDSSVSIEISEQVKLEHLLKIDLFRKGDKIFFASDYLKGRDPIEVTFSDLCIKSSSALPRVMACISSTTLDLVVETQNSTLSLTANKNENPKWSEIFKKKLSLEDLVALTKSFTFSTALEAEHVFQAKKAIGVSAGLLLPHIALTPIVDTAQGGLGSLDALEYLVPFVFPGRWYQLANAKENYQAELYSFATLRANEIFATEGLYFSILESELIKEATQKVLEDDEAALEQIKKFVADEKLVEQQSLIIQENILGLKDSLHEIRSDLSKEYSSLSQFIGLSAYDRIHEIDLIDLSTVKVPELQIDLAAEALLKSLEWKQLNHAERAAKITRDGEYFMFLDPNPNESSSFGFGYADHLDLLNSQSREVHFNLADLEGRTIDEAQGLVDFLDHLRVHLPEAEERCKVVEKMHSNDWISLKALKDFDSDTFAYHSYEMLADQLIKIHLQMSALKAQSKINRLLLSGNYSDISPKD